MKNFRLTLFLIMIATAISVTPAMALTLNIDGATNQLLGATGVDVGGSLYDVMFIDGTCIGVFNGCDAPSHFTFTNLPDALSASQSLLDQVLLDGPDGTFDTDPQLTAGIDSSIYATILTPYHLNPGPSTVDVTVTFNSFDLDEVSHIGGPLGVLSDSDTALIDTVTWARWTESSAPAPVPEPATMILLGTGLVGLAGARFRKKRA